MPECTATKIGFFVEYSYLCRDNNCVFHPFMFKSKIKYYILTLLLVLLCSSGCVKFKQIRPLSAGIESIVPEGFRKVSLFLMVEVDNPSSQLTISDMEGSVFYSGTILGKFTVDPVVLKARTLDKYSVRMVVTLADGVTVWNLMALAKGNIWEQCTLDVSAKAALKNGISKKIKYEGVPLGNFVNQ